MNFSPNQVDVALAHDSVEEAPVGRRLTVVVFNHLALTSVVLGSNPAYDRFTRVLYRYSLSLRKRC